MKLKDILVNTENFSKNWTQENFIYELLDAYAITGATITRLRGGSINVAKGNGEVALKNKVHFIPVTDGRDLYEVLNQNDSVKFVEKHKFNFIIVTDFVSILSRI